MKTRLAGAIAALALFTAGAIAQVPSMPNAVPLPGGTGHAQFFDTNGNVLAGGFVYTYAAGTTTPLATYTDSTAATPNANPVVLDSSGSANIWIQGQAYKLVVQNSAAVQQWTADNVTDTTFFYVQHLKFLSDASTMSYKQGATGSITQTIQAKLQESVSVFDFGGSGNCSSDNSAALTAAETAVGSGGTVLLPQGCYYFTANHTVAAGVMLEFDKGATLKANTGVTLTLGQIIAAPARKIFDTSGGGTITFSGAQQFAYPEWWGALGTGTGDDTAAFNTAYLSLTNTPHTALWLRGGANYPASCIHVQPYVHLFGNQATISSASGASCTNGLLYTSQLSPGSYNPEVMIQDLNLIGNPSIAQNCLDLASVQVNGFASNISASKCGLAGINLNLANLYTLFQVSAFGNGVNDIVINNSNDVKVFAADAETGTSPSSSGQPFVIENSYNVSVYGLHCELRNNNECLQISASFNASVNDLRALYLVAGTYAAAATIKSGSANAILNAISADSQVAGITLTNLIADSVDSINIAGGGPSSGFGALKSWGRFDQRAEYVNGSLTVGGLTRINNALEVPGGLLSFGVIAESTSGAPAVSGCGLAGGYTAVGTNQSGYVNAATTGACTLTFTWAAGATYNTMSPACFAYDVNHPALFAPASIPTTTQSVLAGTATSGDAIVYSCAVGN